MVLVGNFSPEAVKEYGSFGLVFITLVTMLTFYFRYLPRLYKEHREEIAELNEKNQKHTSELVANHEARYERLQVQTVEAMQKIQKEFSDNLKESLHEVTQSLRHELEGKAGRN